eukprot:438970_1
MIFFLILIVTTSSNTFESSNYPGYFIRHRGYKLYVDPYQSSQLFNDDSSFKVVKGLNNNPDYISFESVNFPTYYIAHSGYRLSIRQYQNTDLFKQDASWKKRSALNGKPNYFSFESSNYPGYYFRHRNYEIWLDAYSSTSLYRNDASFTFNPKLEGCSRYKNFQWLGTDSLFPTTATQITIPYDNYGYNSQQAGNVGADTCEEATYEITQETHWDIGIQVSTSVNIFGSGVDVSISASVGGSNSNTKGTLESKCTNYNFESTDCPGRYFCKRIITIQEVQQQTKEFTAILVCDDMELPYKGKMTISGGFDVKYEDQFKPMGCQYYDTVLPFCDDCTTQDKCNSCEPDYYLITNGNKRQCISYGDCVHACGGSPDMSVPNEYECKNANIASVECQREL